MAEEYWPPNSCDCKTYSKSPQKTKQVWDRVKKLCRAKNRRDLEIQRLKLRAQQKIKAGKKPEALVILREMKRLKDMKLTDYIAEKESAKLAREAGGANSGGRRSRRRTRRRKRRRRRRRRRRTRRGRGKVNAAKKERARQKRARSQKLRARRAKTAAPAPAAGYPPGQAPPWIPSAAAAYAAGKIRPPPPGAPKQAGLDVPGGWGAPAAEARAADLAAAFGDFQIGPGSPGLSKSMKRMSIKKKEGGRRRTRRRH